jgi:hypothetical protein
MFWHEEFTSEDSDGLRIFEEPDEEKNLLACQPDVARGQGSEAIHAFLQYRKEKSQSPYKVVASYGTIV